MEEKKAKKYHVSFSFSIREQGTYGSAPVEFSAQENVPDDMGVVEYLRARLRDEIKRTTYSVDFQELPL